MPKDATRLESAIAETTWTLQNLGRDWAAADQADAYQMWAKDRRAMFDQVGNFPTTQRENERLRALKDRYVGERLFVIGNGPSLNKTDLSFLKNEFTFAVNRFYLMFDRIDWRPTFFMANDWEVTPDNLTEIATLDDSTVFWPVRFRGAIDETDDVFLVNTRNARNKADTFSLDITDGVVMGGTVLSSVLQIAHYLGFNPIMLIGTDVSYSVDSSVKQEGRVLDNGIRQFLTSTGDDANHFDPSYFGAGKKWHNPNPDAMKQGFQRCAEAMAADGGRLLNATVGGELNEVQRVNYDNLFETDDLGLVSIVVPSYNALDYLPETIDSVRRQTYENWELIIVDDGSTDGTADYLRTAADSDPRIRAIILDVNGGKSAARNRGMDEATGSAITFLDADDMYLRQKLQHHMRILHDQPELDAVAGCHIRVDEDGRTQRVSSAGDHAGQLVPATSTFGGCPISLIATTFRAEAVANVRFDATRRWAEDWEFVMRVIAGLGLKILHDPQPVARYRMTPQAITKVSRSFADGHIAIVDECLHLHTSEAEWLAAYPHAKRTVGLRLAGRLALTGKTNDAAEVLADSISLEPFTSPAAQSSAVKRSIEFWSRQLASPLQPQVITKLTDEVVGSIR